MEKKATGTTPQVPQELKKTVKSQQESDSSDSFASSGEEGAAFSDEGEQKTKVFFDASRADETQQALAHIREQKRQKMAFDPKEALR